jgi:bifunctional DNA-binding transcriptional regulator/antitoxin component of YhaV-PrlF toxin-antitoxin module
MKAYEYYAEILPDGHLSIPDDLREKLKLDSKVRVMLFLEDDDTVWEKLTISEFVAGYAEKDSLYDSL